MCAILHGQYDLNSFLELFMTQSSGIYMSITLCPSDSQERDMGYVAVLHI